MITSMDRKGKESVTGNDVTDSVEEKLQKASDDEIETSANETETENKDNFQENKDCKNHEETNGEMIKSGNRRDFRGGNVCTLKEEEIRDKMSKSVQGGDDLTRVRNEGVLRETNERASENKESVRGKTESTNILKGADNHKIVVDENCNQKRTASVHPAEDKDDKAESGRCSIKDENQKEDSNYIIKKTDESLEDKSRLTTGDYDGRMNVDNIQKEEASHDKQNIDDILNGEERDLEKSVGDSDNVTDPVKDKEKRDSGGTLNNASDNIGQDTGDQNLQHSDSSKTSDDNKKDGEEVVKGNTPQTIVDSKVEERSNKKLEEDDRRRVSQNTNVRSSTEGRNSPQKVVGIRESNRSNRRNQHLEESNSNKESQNKNDRLVADSVNVNSQQKDKSDVDGQQKGVSDVDDKQKNFTGDDDKQKSVSDADGQQKSVSDVDDKQKSVSDADNKQKSVSDVEDQQKSVSDADNKQKSVSDADNKQKSVSDVNDKQKSVIDVDDKQKSVSDADNKQKSVSDVDDKHKSLSDADNKQKSVSDVEDKQKSVSDADDKQKSVSDVDDKQKSVSDADNKQKSVSDVEDKQKSVSDADNKQKSVSDVEDKHKSLGDADNKQKSVSNVDDKHKSVSDADDKQKSVSDVDDKQKSVSDADDKQKSVSVVDDKQKSVSNADVKQKSVSGVDGQQKSVSDADNKQQSVSDADSQKKDVSDVDGQQKGVSNVNGQVKNVSDVDDQQKSVSDIDGQQKSVSDGDGQQEDVIDFDRQQRAVSYFDDQQKGVSNVDNEQKDVSNLDCQHKNVSYASPHLKDDPVDSYQNMRQGDDKNVSQNIGDTALPERGSNIAQQRDDSNASQNSADDSGKGNVQLEDEIPQDKTKETTKRESSDAKENGGEIPKEDVTEDERDNEGNEEKTKTLADFIKKDRLRRSIVFKMSPIRRKSGNESSASHRETEKAYRRYSMQMGAVKQRRNSSISRRYSMFNRESSPEKSTRNMEIPEAKEMEGQSKDKEDTRNASYNTSGRLRKVSERNPTPHTKSRKRKSKVDWLDNELSPSSGRRNTDTSEEENDKAGRSTDGKSFIANESCWSNADSQTSWKSTQFSPEMSTLGHEDSSARPHSYSSALSNSLHRETTLSPSSLALKRSRTSSLSKKDARNPDGDVKSLVSECRSTLEAENSATEELLTSIQTWRKSRGVKFNTPDRSDSELSSTYRNRSREKSSRNDDPENSTRTESGKRNILIRQGDAQSPLEHKIEIVISNEPNETLVTSDEKITLVIKLSNGGDKSPEVETREENEEEKVEKDQVNREKSEDEIEKESENEKPHPQTPNFGDTQKSETDVRKGDESNCDSSESGEPSDSHDDKDGETEQQNENPESHEIEDSSLNNDEVSRSIDNKSEPLPEVKVSASNQPHKNYTKERSFTRLQHIPKRPTEVEPEVLLFIKHAEAEQRSRVDKILRDMYLFHSTKYSQLYTNMQTVDNVKRSSVDSYTKQNATGLRRKQRHFLYSSESDDDVWTPVIKMKQYSAEVQKFLGYGKKVEKLPSQNLATRPTKKQKAYAELRRNLRYV